VKEQLMSKLEERVNRQIEYVQAKLGRPVYYYERVLLMLDEAAKAGKDTVTIASKTKAHRLSDTSYEVLYDNVRIVTVDEKGITLHNDPNLGDGPVDDRMQMFFPQWKRPYPNGNYHYQPTITVHLSNKQAWRNWFSLNRWAPYKMRNGDYSIQHQHWKGDQRTYGAGQKTSVTSLNLSWAELKEHFDGMKKVK
jgi:hypothetical protein